MNVDTDRRTNAVFVARSRSHALVDIGEQDLCDGMTLTAGP